MCYNKHMPKKIRELIKMIEKAGWRLERCKGSHRQYVKEGRSYTIAGALGDDPKPYQEKEINKLINKPQK